MIKTKFIQINVLIYEPTHPFRQNLADVCSSLIMVEIKQFDGSLIKQNPYLRKDDDNFILIRK